MPILELIPNLKFHYIDENPNGNPVVLLLHGLGATSESWGLQRQILEDENFRVLAPDAPGFGKSSYPGGGTSIAKMASEMAHLLFDLGVYKAHVAGISMGGTIALQLALDYPNLVDKLVLINTFSSLRPKRASIWLYFAFRLFLVHTLGLDTQARTVSKRIFPNPEQAELRKVLIEQINQADLRGYRATMRALGLFTVTSRLSEIRNQTLIVTGQDDTTVPAENQQTLADCIPNARQIILSNAGHALIVEQPEKFNYIFLQFLRDELIG